MKEIYQYNYFKTYKSIEKRYKNSSDKTFYTSYLMGGKFIIGFVYPLYVLETTLKISDYITKYSFLYWIILAIIFFVSDYYIARKKFDHNLSVFEKKSNNEMAKLRLHGLIVKALVISLNLILIFII